MRAAREARHVEEVPAAPPRRPPRSRPGGGSRRACARRRPGPRPRARAPRRRPAGCAAGPSRASAADRVRVVRARRASRAAAWPSRSTIRSKIARLPRGRRRVLREEDHADRVAAGRRQLDAARAASRAAGTRRGSGPAVPAPSPGLGIAAARAAVLEVEQHRDALLDDVVRLLAADVRDEADAAGVVLEGRIVETLLLRHSGGVHPVGPLARATLTPPRRPLLRSSETGGSMRES